MRMRIRLQMVRRPQKMPIYVCQHHSIAGIISHATTIPGALPTMTDSAQRNTPPFESPRMLSTQNLLHVTPPQIQSSSLITACENNQTSSPPIAQKKKSKKSTSSKRKRAVADDDDYGQGPGPIGIGRPLGECEENRGAKKPRKSNAKFQRIDQAQQSPDALASELISWLSNGVVNSEMGWISGVAGVFQGDKEEAPTDQSLDSIVAQIEALEAVSIVIEYLRMWYLILFKSKIDRYAISSNS